MLAQQLTRNYITHVSTSTRHPLHFLCRHSPQLVSLYKPSNFMSKPLLTCCTIIEMQNGHNQENNHQNDDGVPLMALNHVSRVCRSVDKSLEFYIKVLGFVVIERPESFNFDGAWLFNYGIGIHLVQSKDDKKLPHDNEHLDPMDNHISFQCENMDEMEKKLKEMDIKYMKRTVGEGDSGAIDQLFFKDPDGFMLEICNCENLKLVPQMDSIARIKLPFDRHNPPIEI